MAKQMIWKGRLGVPYQGSKNQIAKEIIGMLPRGKRFVDLFAGGCAMTHAAMISGKYDCFLANDLHGFGLRLFQDAIVGKCNGKWKEWVSREEFMAKRDTDPLIALCWSFGNNGATYLYGRDKESLKHELHVARENGVKGQEELRSFETVYGLERLQELAQVQGLGTSFLSYSDYQHEDGDIVYCDPPYRSATEPYRFLKRSGISFDFDAFDEWVLTRDYPVFVSEYSMPSGFASIWEKAKIKLMSSKKDGSKIVEHIFVADRYAALAKTVRAGIDTVDEAGDADTADLLTGLSRTLDKALWMLEAHLEGA